MILFQYQLAEKNGYPQSRDMIDGEPVVVFTKYSDESHQKVPRNLDLERRTAAECPGQDKKRSHFDVSLCEQVSLCSLKNWVALYKFS